jgi:glutathione S-transferase
MAERGLMMTRHWMNSLEERLSASAFIAGDRFTVADITAFICVDFAKWVGVRTDDSHPALKAWYQGVRSRPSAAA